MNVKKLAVISLVSAGLAAIACGARHHARSPEERAAHMEAHITDRVEDVLDEVDATDDQRTRILGIKDRLLTDFREVHRDGHAARKEMLAEWQKDRPNAKRLHELVDERAKEFLASAHDAVDAMVEVHSVLTPEQRKKLDEHFESRWHH